MLSGETIAPATPKGAANYRIYCFLLTKHRPIRQQNVPCLGQLARKKFGVTKISRGRQKGNKGAPKIVSTFLFFRHLSFCGGSKKSGGEPNSNVTQLCIL